MSRKLVLGLLVMLALVVSSFTYAYWSNVNLVGEEVGSTVKIGQGRTATVTANLTQGAGTATLVPTGEQANSISTNPQESIEFAFSVAWSDDLLALGTGTVGIVVDNVSNATAAGLLNFSFTNNPTITEGTPLSIIITVTLTAPADVTEYNAIINAGVTFDVTFTVTPSA